MSVLPGAAGSSRAMILPDFIVSAMNRLLPPGAAQASRMLSPRLRREELDTETSRGILKVKGAFVREAADFVPTAGLHFIKTGPLRRHEKGRNRGFNAPTGINRRRLLVPFEQLPGRFDAELPGPARDQPVRMGELRGEIDRFFGQTDGQLAGDGVDEPGFLGAADLIWRARPRDG